MWPNLLDLDKETCLGILRRLELEAFSAVISALRAQGELSKERRKIINDLSNIFSVSIDRQKTEIRRAVNDEVLTTIAAAHDGSHDDLEWAREGRRIIPLLRRAPPITPLTEGSCNRAKILGDTQNKILKSPEYTRTPKYKTLQGKQSPFPLEEILESGIVKAPKISMPKVQIKDEVIILPSGLVVRLKDDHESGKATVTSVIAGSDETPKKRRKQKMGDFGHFMPPPPPRPPPSSQNPSRNSLINSSSSSSSFLPSSKLGRKRPCVSSHSPKDLSSISNVVSQSGHGYARQPIISERIADSTTSQIQAIKSVKEPIVKTSLPSAAVQPSSRICSSSPANCRVSSSSSNNNSSSSSSSSVIKCGTTKLLPKSSSPIYMVAPSSRVVKVNPLMSYRSSGMSRHPFSGALKQINKPSVIVVQRTPGVISKNSSVAKDQRVYPGKPLVVVSKAETISKATSSSNLIVYDLSQEQLSKNTVLSDILQATGIISDSSSHVSIQNDNTSNISCQNEESWIVVEQSSDSENQKNGSLVASNEIHENNLTDNKTPHTNTQSSETLEDISEVLEETSQDMSASKSEKCKISDVL